MEPSPGANAEDLACPQCGCCLLAAGAAHWATLSPAASVPTTAPGAAPESVSGAWAVGDMYDFANVGFTVPDEAGVKFVACAECELGPLGFHRAGEEPAAYYVIAGRVAGRLPGSALPASISEAEMQQLRGMVPQQALSAPAAAPRAVRFEASCGMELTERAGADGARRSVMTAFVGEDSAAEHCGQVQIGDVVVRVAGEDVECAGVEETLDRIRNGARPIEVEFRRPE